MSRAGRIVLALLATVVVGYAALAAILYFAQRSILFVPGHHRPMAASAGVPGLQDITLHTDDGLDLLAWWLPPARPGSPVLAYFHGNGGTLLDRIPRVRIFAALGWGLLMPEYRGYGGNPGSPSEAGFARDAGATMQALAARGISGERTVIYGESIGTGVAVQVAVSRPPGSALAALILESPYTSIAAIARRRYWFLPVGLLLKDRFDSLSRIGSLRAPLLILQGEQDTIVPPALGRQLYAGAPEPKQLWEAPEAGHENLMQHGAADAIRDFMARTLSRGSPAGASGPG